MCNIYIYILSLCYMGFVVVLCLWCVYGILYLHFDCIIDAHDAIHTKIILHFELQKDMPVPSLLEGREVPVTSLQHWRRPGFMSQGVLVSWVRP